MIVAQVIFWLSVLLVLHTYVFYPLMLQLFSRGRKGNSIVFGQEDELPLVSVIIAAHNEEACIYEKIRSIYNGSYPQSQFEVLIGSDNSNDRTSEIVTGMLGQFPSLQFFDFRERRGKGSVVNDLVNSASGTILVLTDANVMFDRDTLFYMVRHFKNPAIGLVDTNMVNIGMKEEGISHQEKAYISREVKIKEMESFVWGAMMGPFGGCYAIRKEDYRQVPSNFLVDDFYINMTIFEKGKLAINDTHSIVFENIPDDLKIEFKRKVRIGTGNFQNLRRFWRLVFTARYGFAFVSHKIIRWFGPFLLLAALGINIYLALQVDFYLFLLAGQLLIYMIPLIDWLLKKVNVNFGPFRLATHFFSMNAALFTGFFRSLGNVRSGAWERTERG
jgi:cellulose synthase/poly-beta-1,6-N-acetylglucosamine synthase-like glycosyltransferase